MKRKYKIIIIVLVSSIFTYLIYFLNFNNKIYFVAIGDGISSGETSFNIDGISYNDYIKDYFSKKKLLKRYNNDYSYKNYKLGTLIDDINNNAINNKAHLKQIISKSDLLIIGIGEEELTKLAITSDLDLKAIKNFINNYNLLLKEIKKINDKKIIVLGFYQNKYLDKTNVIILNSELANICNRNDITFINISDLLLNNDYFANNDTYYFNYKGHKEIAKIIINSL